MQGPEKNSAKQKKATAAFMLFALGLPAGPRAGKGAGLVKRLLPLWGRGSPGAPRGSCGPGTYGALSRCRVVCRRADVSRESASRRLPPFAPVFPPGVVRFLQGLAVAGARCRAGKHAANKKPRRRARLCQLHRCRHGAAVQTFERHIQFPTGKAQTPSPGQKAPRPTPRPAGPLPGLLPGRCRPPLPGTAVQPDAPAPPRSAGSRPNMARSLVHSRPFCSATA